MTDQLAWVSFACLDYPRSCPGGWRLHHSNSWRRYPFTVPGGGTLTKAIYDLWTGNRTWKETLEEWRCSCCSSGEESLCPFTSSALASPVIQLLFWSLQSHTPSAIDRWNFLKGAGSPSRFSVGTTRSWKLCCKPRPRSHQNHHLRLMMRLTRLQVLEQLVQEHGSWHGERIPRFPPYQMPSHHKWNPRCSGPPHAFFCFQNDEASLSLCMCDGIKELCQRRTLQIRKYVALWRPWVVGANVGEATRKWSRSPQPLLSRHGYAMVCGICHTWKHHL